ncbi:kinase-like domain-containing protein [Hyaloraphidium curvatum]|nr:kinase-like domain-containing protein [Hyaloraphidium curvatum]
MGSRGAPPAAPPPTAATPHHGAYHRPDLSDAEIYEHGRHRRKHYTDRKILGSGAEGTVKIALAASGEKVAVKSMVKPPLPKGVDKVFGRLTGAAKKAADARAEFERGLRQRISAMKQHNNHPHLPVYLEFFETEDKFYIVSQVCRGGDLGKYIKDRGGYLPEDEALYITTTLLRTLAYLHDHGITHRDLKPSNIFFYRKNDLDSIRIADFTGAFIDETVSAAVSYDDGPLDPAAFAKPSGKMMIALTGTPFYLAPDVIRGTGYTSKVDVWSLGCVAYEMLFGETPFAFSPDVAALFRRVLAGDYHIPAGHPNAISEEAVSFVRGLLQVDPARRPSAGEALRHPWIVGAQDPQKHMKRVFSGVEVFIRADSGELTTAW